MAQIFVSHSGADVAFVDFLARVAAGTKVRIIFEEYEKLISGAVSAERIRADIRASNALFVALSPAAQELPHTRDWIVWEAGVGSNRDIWVLERLSDFGDVSTVIPFLRHFLVYEPNEGHFPYFRRIIESYDDSGVFPTAAVTSGLGGMFLGGKGAAMGAVAGVILSDRGHTRPSGCQVRCANCGSSYQAHLPRGRDRFRCPVCNVVLAVNTSE